MLSTLLQRLPRPAEDLNGPVLGACLHLLHVVDACKEVELVGAALQGLLLDFRLWSDAGVEAQALLLEGISSVAERRVVQLRAFVGPQLLLDVLRVHVCTSAQPSPKNPRASRKRHSSTASAAAAISASPSIAAPTHAADGAVICYPVTTTPGSSSQKKGGDGDGASAVGAGGGSDGVTSTSPAAGGGAGDTGRSLESGAGSRSRRDSAYGGTAAAAADTFNQLAFLEGGFGDIMDVGDGQGGAEGDCEGGPEGGGGAGGYWGGALGGGRGSGLDAAVVCLQECNSSILRRGLLRVLLGLRDEVAVPLRRELLRSMFLWEAAPTLLSRKGYATNVRRDCLALALWLITETHATGEERLLSPQAKIRRQSAAAVAAAPSAASITVAPNLAAAYSAELLVKDGGSGGEGGGVSPLGTAGGGGGGKGDGSGFIVGGGGGGGGDSGG
ncbi:unnamed protein product, partial [Sphacelaria rigidula]